MYIIQNPEKKFSIIWNPKCACTTIKLWYLSTMGQCDFVEKINTGEYPLHRIHSYIGYNKQPWRGTDENLYDPSFTNLMFVRNPWDRVVSFFKSKTTKILKSDDININLDSSYTFEQFVDIIYNRAHINHHTAIQCWLLHKKPKMKVKIIKFETMNIQLQEVIKDLKLDPYTFDKLNCGQLDSETSKYVGNIPLEELWKTGVPSYQNFYNDVTKEMIKETYKFDLNYLDYTFNS